VTAAGSAYQELFNNFVSKWQAGRVHDLEAGLADVDQQIDAQLANAEGEQVP
jgi:multiple sugar transport system substrate-binding protein